MVGVAFICCTFVAKIKYHSFLPNNDMDHIRESMESLRCLTGNSEICPS